MPVEQTVRKKVFLWSLLTKRDSEHPLDPKRFETGVLDFTKWHLLRKNKELFLRNLSFRAGIFWLEPSYEVFEPSYSWSEILGNIQNWSQFEILFIEKNLFFWFSAIQKNNTYWCAKRIRTKCCMKMNDMRNFLLILKSVKLCQVKWYFSNFLNSYLIFFILP